MDLRTRRRVLLDTAPRRLGRFLALALVLHAPLTPLAGLLGLVRLLGREPEVPAAPPLTEIPLDLIDDDGGGAAKAPEPAPPPPEPAAEAPAELPTEPTAPVTKPKKPKKEPKPEVPDAGAPEDAGAPDAKPGEGIGSPVAGISDKRVVDPNANVQVLIHNDRVRKHPLGDRIGPLLKNIYQWRDFFGPTSIDPIQDIDRMLIVGSQLRDSREVTAILQFNVPGSRLHDAVDALVTRDPEGGWLEGPVPVAKAHADRGERFFIFPSAQILIVAPPASQAAAQRMKLKRLPRPKGDEIALARIATPWRAFLGAPISIPKTIASVELRLSPGADGGVVIDILAHDESEELAIKDARTLTSALDLGIMGSITIGTSRLQGGFEPVGADIKGELALPRRQVQAILELARGLLGGAAPRPRASATADSPAPPVVPTPSVVVPTPTPEP